MLLLLSLTALPSHAGPKKLPPLESASTVDLNRYQGRWYEVARIPVHWERRCATSVTINFSLQPDGTLRGHYECTRGDGTHDQRDSIIRPSATDKSRWSVYYVRPFWETRWILMFDERYRWALVGTPDRKNLWLLSRTPTLAQSTIDRVVYLAKNRGYETGELEFPKQP